MSKLTSINDEQGDDFATTHWTKVLACRGNSEHARMALRELLANYYRPVFKYVRHSRFFANDAEDLTQEFFAKMLDGQGMDTVRPERGRFRAFLLGAVKHFLADQYDRRQTLKRGGSAQTLSLDQTSANNDTEFANHASLIADPQGFPEDSYFDSAWAMELVEQVIEKLKQDYIESDREAIFLVLRPALMGQTLDPASTSTLNMSDGAIKVAIHRLRKRFGSLVRAEISRTVEDPKEVEAELDYLLAALSKRT